MYDKKIKPLASVTLIVYWRLANYASNIFYN